MRTTKKTFALAGAGVIASGAIAIGVGFAGADSPPPPTTTPIKHVVVLFQENISFDHYFGTYPHAVNGPGETSTFTAAPGTPSINGLTADLLTNNPNAANPQRLGPADVVPTIACDNNHNYSPEQKAMDGGLMDRFVENTTGSSPCAGDEVMNYYDGNSVTAMWNYAQRFSMSDNFYGTGFGPSTPGAAELVSGNTATAVNDAGAPIAGPTSNIDHGTIFSNGNPFLDYDGCSPAGSSAYALGAVSGPAASTSANTSKNVGDLLNASGVTWGWFQGGFTPTSRLAPTTAFPHGQPVCASAHNNVADASQQDYDAHHNPFAYYKSTANPEHLPPTGAIGTTDQANHQYDQTDFDAAVQAGKLPAVSFVKAAHYQDGHAGYSDPLDEQRYLATEINEIEASPDWPSTAIIIAYDDSDGWYDHQAPPIVRSSTSTEDFYSGTGQCGTTHAGPPADHANDRCGFGPRLPLLVISPYAKSNFVDHSITDQTSILRFIEDNWSLGRIGNGSLDVKANPLTNMFDFNPSDRRTPALKLEPDTGLAFRTTPGGGFPLPPLPTPPGGGGLPIPGGGGGSAPPPVSVGPITCSAGLGASNRIVITCVLTRSVAAPTAMRMRLLRSSTQLATARTVLTKGRIVRITLRTKKALERGRYSVGISLAQSGRAATGLTRTVRL